MRHSGTGGTERYLNQMSVHLAEHGHEVSVVCRSHERAPHPDVRFVVLRDAALGSAWRLWAFARSVERHVATARYDLVYGLGKTWTHDVVRLGGGLHETYLEAMHAGALARRLAQCGPKNRLAVTVEQRALGKGNYRHVITNSEMVRRDAVRRHGVPEERISVVYNGVDLVRFHPRRHLSAAAELRRSCDLTEDDFVFLFLGTGYRRKGLDWLLRAFAPIAAEQPKARLLVVGYDSARHRCEGLAAKLGIAGRTRFLGGRRDAEICFAAANAYVLPTRYDPFANSTLEALACGLPVITSSSNGGSEVLTHRTNGSVIPGDGDDAALSMELRFWSEGTQARDAVEIARSTAERYPQERTAAESTAILERCAAEKRTA
jgi:UDP-glucose:(heptosyl)LPS alpha-1,3-glucosyltransferase